MNEENIIDVSIKDIPSGLIQTQISVVAGGPCSGKTTIINALRKRNYNVKYEPAELLLKQKVEEGGTAKDIRKSANQWQKIVVKADLAMLQSILADERTFIDTSLIETQVYCRRAGLEYGVNLKYFMKNFRFKEIFFLEPISDYEKSNIRIEDKPTALQLSGEILKAYYSNGYNPIIIPKSSLEDRMTMILEKTLP